MQGLLDLFRGKRPAEEGFPLVSPANRLEFRRLSDTAVLPTQAHSTDAGYDLSSVVDYVLPPGQNHLFNTNISVRLPSGYAGLVQGRSGLALHHRILTHSGVIDHGYTGDLGVILFNLGTEDFKVTKGDRIAQLVVVKLWKSGLEFEESGPKRLKQGFGSSGQGQQTSPV